MGGETKEITEGGTREMRGFLNRRGAQGHSRKKRQSLFFTFTIFLIVLSEV